MEAEIRERTGAYISARHHHPAWQLLAARRAPLILSCLQTLFEQSRDGVGFDDALRRTMPSSTSALARYCGHSGSGSQS